MLVKIDNEYQNERTKIIQNGSTSIFSIPNAKEIVFTIKEDVYRQIVDISYNFSSKVLLNLLLHDHKLLDRLRYIFIIKSN